ncbi:MAG: TolC family protein [Bacteroidales bacterium]
MFSKTYNRKEVKKVIFSGSALIVLGLTLAFEPDLQGQQTRLTLGEAVALAQQNNHLLNVRKLQVSEKEQKVNEDRIKYLPVIGIGGTYQYNSNLPSLTIDRGMFGELPLGGVGIPLPATDEVIIMGNHETYNAGISVYQPITQIGKINAGVQVSKTDLRIARSEEAKTSLIIGQTAEKLFFGLLIVRKQIEEAGIKVELARARLSDAQNALAAGKTTEAGPYGLAAAVADEEQNLLKLQILYDDYSADLKQLTGIESEEEILPEPVNTENLIEKASEPDTALNLAAANNNDLKMASLARIKAGYSIRASRYSYLPDLGLLGGYTYQHGTVVYPKNNAYIGASLKWNLQDLLTNRTVQLQRNFAMQQAEENLYNIKEQVNKDIMKTFRKLKQCEELINVAGRVVTYRREDLKIQSDRRSSGLNLGSDLLAARAAMAKAESDYYSAQLNYRIALTELKILTGTYQDQP